MNKKLISVLFSLHFCLFIVFPSLVFSQTPEVSTIESLTLTEIFTKIQSNQSKIKDMYAETTTTIISSISMPGAKDKGPQKMVQKGKMWTKGKDKSKIEMLSPMKQITITNGDQMAIINPDTGQKMVQDLKKLREKSGMSDSSQQMSLEKAKEFFDLSVRQSDSDSVRQYIIVGVPKKENKFLAKMEFYVDSEKGVPVKILMYGPKDKIMSKSEIGYEKISDVWVPVKNKSYVDTPAGKMEVEMGFENIKVNKGIKDSEFKIE